MIEFEIWKNGSLNQLRRSCTSCAWQNAAARKHRIRSVRRIGVSELRSLTFELSGSQRQDARPGLAKMYRVPPDRAWWPAVGAPLERGVRPQIYGETLISTMIG